MGMHYHIKGAAEQHVIDAITGRAMARELANWRAELCSVLWGRVVDMRRTLTMARDMYFDATDDGAEEEG